MKTEILLSLYNMNVKSYHPTSFPLTPTGRPEEGAIGRVGGSALSRGEARLRLTSHLGEQASPGSQLEEEESGTAGIGRT